MSDREVLNRLQVGDEKALDYLYKRYFRMMARLIKKQGGSEDDAKDAYQEALIVLWQKVHSNNFTLTAKISTFLYSICANLWKKELERRSRFQQEDQAAESGEEDRSGEQKENAQIVAAALADLGDTCQKVLTYFYFEGLSMEEIADRMGFANTDTAKTRKYKCKRKLDELVRNRYTASDFLD